MSSDSRRSSLGSDGPRAEAPALGKVRMLTAARRLTAAMQSTAAMEKQRTGFAIKGSAAMMVHGVDD